MAIRPCIHKNIKEDWMHFRYKHDTDLTIFKRGCGEGMTEHVRTRVFMILVYMFALELAIQVFGIHHHCRRHYPHYCFFVVVVIALIIIPISILIVSVVLLLNFLLFLIIALSSPTSLLNFFSYSYSSCYYFSSFSFSPP